MQPKLIIIDTGISKNDYIGNVIGGINLFDKDGSFADDNGHGTQCANTIAQFCAKRPDIFAIKILNQNKECSLEVLMEALEYTRDIDIRTICLSLTTIKEESMPKLQKIIHTLKNNGKIVIASTHNQGYLGYPAACDGTIGVDGIVLQDNKEYWYNKGKVIQCMANRVPILVKNIGNTYTMFGGTSKATAIVTSIVLDKLLIKPDLNYQELEEWLELSADRVH